MAIEVIVLEIKLSNTFEYYLTHMKTPEQKAMFKEIGVNTFQRGSYKDDAMRRIVIFEVSENVLYDFFA